MSTESARPITGDTAKRRSQAVAGAVAGVAVVAVLVTVFATVRGGDDKPAQPAAAPPPASVPADATPEAVPSEAPSAAQPSEAAPAPVETPPELSKQPVVKAGTGTLKDLKVTPLVAGRGPAVKAGQTITANYVLVRYKTGEVMDSSWKRGEPFSTPIGAGRVIQGWDKGIPGQKVGSRIQLDVPAALAYGPQEGDLRFVVDILAAQ
ncbi:FKBP-type peptidyl-prolyl cis-trans isomerase [Actinoplanes sp. URMC 104]|uniref:FKBP-type peptidyl-prolyl cis-trans isomerase n=1 Tax=Actinoplanes sp. URMC 104 TaxID=3423409 RepID=UPI003F1A138D